jgi:HEAT repeat protein
VISSSNIATLITALRTEDRRAHTLVVEDLVKMGSAAVEPLLAVLRDTNANVRAGAARALGKIGDQRALNALVFCLRSDPSPEVRKSAVWALHLGDARATPALIEALSDTDEWVRFGAIIVLAKMGTASVRPLMAALHHSNAVVRAAAAETLGRIGDRRAADMLAKALTDLNQGVRFQVAISLGRMSDARAVDPLIEIVRNPASELRTKAIKALGQIGDVRAVEPLIEAVYGENDRWVRLFAIEALGQIGDLRAVEVLADAAYDESHDIRTKAIVTLGEIHYTFALDALYSLAMDIDVYVEDQQTALFELGKRGDVRALDGLVYLLRQDGRPETRMYAALVLADLQISSVVAPMIDALCDDIADVAAQVLKALVKLGDTAVDGLAETLMTADDAERRLCAVRALGEIASPNAVSTLAEVALNGAEQWWVREEARAILQNLGYDPHLPG